MGSSDLSCLGASIIYRLRINCRSMEKNFVGIPSLIRNDQTDYMMIRHILIRAHMEQHAHNTYIYNGTKHNSRCIHALYPSLP